MNRNKLPYFLIIIFLSISFFCIAQAQNYKKANAKKLQKSSGEKLSFYKEYAFENVNKIPFYYNKKKFDQIQKFEKEQEWEELYKVLKEYVKNFGIQNFYKNTYMLWRLAKLTELFGNFEESKFLYKLVLKHHRDDLKIKKIAFFNDSLNTSDKGLFVPIDYYYELVDFRNEIDTLRPPRGVHLNMGNFINSNHADYAPTLGANDYMILFTSRRNVDRKRLNPVQNEDIYYSIKQGNKWTEAKEFKDINSKYNEGSACLSSDGKTLFFSRCDSPDSYGNCDLFVAELKADSTWGNIRNLGANVNSISWDSHPALSHSGDTLYFASDRIGGFGLSDIYFTYKKPDGRWVPAQNAGPIINTRQNDVSPFIHPKHNVLFFSSNGHILNFGDFDIYKSYNIDHGWGEPQNIGPLINGPGSEFYFTIDYNSKFLFYAKSNSPNLNNTDLYSFPLPMEAQPDANTKFTGTLTDSLTGEAYSGIVSIIDLDNGIEVAPKFLKEDGSFEFDLINNNNYLLVIQGDEFFRIEEIFHLEGDMELHKVTEPVSSKVKFESLEFENGKADLLPEMYGDLIKVSNFLLDNPDFKLKISGHTDSSGQADFNLDLSQQRAEAIRNYIIYFNGVDEERVDAIGYGSSKPIIKEEKTEEDRRVNRRVEFEIYRPNKEEVERMRKERERKRKEQEVIWGD